MIPEVIQLKNAYATVLWLLEQLSSRIDVVIKSNNEKPPRSGSRVFVR